MLVAGRLAGRVGQRALLMVGGTIFGLAFLLLYLATGTAPRYLTELLPGMALTGIGVGLVLPSLSGRWWERRSLLIAVLITPLATARGTYSVAVLYAYHLGRIETRFG